MADIGVSPTKITFFLRFNAINVISEIDYHLKCQELIRRINGFYREGIGL